MAAKFGKSGMTLQCEELESEESHMVPQFAKLELEESRTASQFESLKQKEIKLANNLRSVVKSRTNEEDKMDEQAEIMRAMSRIIQERAELLNKQTKYLKDSTEDLECLTQASCLLNAALVRSEKSQKFPNIAREIRSEIYQVWQSMLVMCDSKEQRVLSREEWEECRRRNLDSLKKVREICSTDCQTINKKWEEYEKFREHYRKSDALYEEGKRDEAMAIMCLAEYPLFEYGQDMLVLEMQILELGVEIASETSTRINHLLSNLLTHSIRLLGPPPCGFCVFSMGLLARCEATPYSDLEFGMLVENEKHKLYFRRLTHLFHMFILDFGETVIPAMCIPSLNDFYGIWGDSTEDFHDDVTPGGLKFDVAMPHACKTPLGRKKPGVVKKHPCELIATPEKMAKYIEAENSLKQGYHLSEMLMNTSFLFGQIKLHTQFLKLVRVTSEKNPETKVKIIEGLAEELMEFPPLSDVSDIISFEHHMYRFISIGLLYFKYLHGVKETFTRFSEGVLILSQRDPRDHIAFDKLFWVRGVFYLLRVLSYSRSGRQTEDFLMLPKMTEANPNDEFHCERMLIHFSAMHKFFAFYDYAMKSVGQASVGKSAVEVFFKYFFLNCDEMGLNDVAAAYQNVFVEDLGGWEESLIFQHTERLREALREQLTSLIRERQDIIHLKMEVAHQYEEKGQYDEAILCLEQAIDAAMICEPAKFLIPALRISQGRILVKTGRPIIQSFMEIGDKESKVASYLIKTENHELTLDLLVKTLTRFNATWRGKITSEYLDTLLNLGIVHYRMDAKSGETMTICREGIKLCRTYFPHDTLLLEFVIRIASIALDEESYEFLYECAFKVIENEEEICSKNSEASSMFCLIHISVAVAFAREGKDNEALSHMERSLEIFSSGVVCRWNEFEEVLTHGVELTILFRRQDYALTILQGHFAKLRSDTSPSILLVYTIPSLIEHCCKVIKALPKSETSSLTTLAHDMLKDLQEQAETARTSGLTGPYVALKVVSTRADALLTFACSPEGCKKVSNFCGNLLNPKFEPWTPFDLPTRISLLYSISKILVEYHQEQAQLRGDEPTYMVDSISTLKYCERVVAMCESCESSQGILQSIYEGTMNSLALIYESMGNGKAIEYNLKLKKLPNTDKVDISRRLSRCFLKINSFHNAVRFIIDAIVSDQNVGQEIWDQLSACLAKVRTVEILWDGY